MSIHSCTCGSGLNREPLYDARGIFCCYYCNNCEEDKRSRYRAEIFTDAHYDAPDLGDDYHDPPDYVDNDDGIYDPPDDDEDEDVDNYDDYERGDFADPGGNSSLRAASPTNLRNLPCPSCERENMLTPKDVTLGYQCDACADEVERGGPF